jgi:hypothetical protein
MFLKGGAPYYNICTDNLSHFEPRDDYNCFYHFGHLYIGSELDWVSAQPRRRGRFHA